MIMRVGQELTLGHITGQWEDMVTVDEGSYLIIRKAHIVGFFNENEVDKRLFSIFSFVLGAVFI